MLERKTVIITGAASGIGFETVRRFSKDPKYNPIFAIDKDPAVHTIFQSSENPNIASLQTNLIDGDKITGMLTKAAASGRIDVIVNAAGIISAGRPSTYYDKEGNPKPELEEMNNINVGTPILVMVEALKIMEKNGGGTIINISSSKHFFPDIYRWKYMVGKSIVSRVTRGLAREWKQKYNVRLVDVQPGNTKTNIDRGVWMEGSRKSEMEAVQGFNSWWRKTFGNDPKKVAEIIYEIAEGKVNATTVFVGFDAKLGRALFLLPFLYRADLLFFAISYFGYKIIEFGRFLKKKTSNS